MQTAIIFDCEFLCRKDPSVDSGVRLMILIR